MINFKTTDKKYPGADQIEQKAEKIFDVHGLYPWTLSKEIIKFVPYIELKEYKLIHSGELISLKQQAAALSDTTGTAALLGLKGAVRGAQASRRAGRSLLEQGLGGLLGAGTGLALTGFLESFSGLNNSRPYEGLYPAEPTKRTYKLPYLNVENVSVDNTWSPVDSKALGNALVGIGQYAGLGALLKGKPNEPSLIETALQAREVEFLMTEPGAALEKIKKFTPADKGDQINLTFYLFNTVDNTKIQENWEILYILTYQNLPNRRSINLIDPPCVYEVTVPGYKYFPAAVIEKLTVTNEGTTRSVNITTGEVVEPSENPDVKIIPEAFKVVMTIRSLFTPTQNLFKYSSNNKDKVLNVFTKSPETTPETPEAAAQRIESGTAFGGGAVGGIPRGGYQKPTGGNIFP